MTHSLNIAIHPLLNPPQFFTVAEILADPSVVPPEPGLYGWWFAPCALQQVPRADCEMRDDRTLLYVGIAPSGQARGARKARTLQDRLRNHCRGPIAVSTLRRSLACLLQDELKLSQRLSVSRKATMSGTDETRLTDWMKEHARVAWSISSTPWIDEATLVHRLPLNIKGSTHPFRHELKALRKRVKAGG